MSKRIFDLLVASLLLVVAAPLALIVAVVVWVDLGAPVLFCQERPGRFGAPFKMLKFRTMRQDLAADGSELPDGQRLTSVGRRLRSTSLDELPELVNVFRGEMSLVGPRPLLMEYLPLYTPEQAGRHAVRPGITGWAQINGRNALTWEEKFELDNWYVSHQCFWLDLKIMLITVFRVFARHGISQPGCATASKFTGANLS